MKRSWIIVLISVFLFIPRVQAEEFDITSTNVILYNLDNGEILYEKDSEERVPIASLTKIMSAIVVIENNTNLDEKIKINYKMLEGLSGYSIIGLKYKNEVSIRELLYGALVASGADAVQALAIHTGGSIENFVSMMNAKAKALGLNNTSFENPIGMDHEDNYSSAKDLAVLLQYGLNNSVFKEIFQTKDYVISGLNLTLKSTLYGYARPLGLDISEITGAKSGFTLGAGYCLASIARIDDVNYLFVNLGSSTSSKANAVKDTLTVYDYYSSNYSFQTIVKKNAEIIKLPIRLGKEKEYIVTAPEEVTLYLKNGIGEDDVNFEYDGVEKINSKIKKGDKLGTVKVVYEGSVLTSFDVKLESELQYHKPLLYISVVLGVIGVCFLYNKKGKSRRKH